VATLDLVTAANSDDIEISDLSGASPIRFGGVSTGPLAGYGIGFSFPNCTLTGADTINSAYLSLMKSGTNAGTSIQARLVAVDEDNRGSFTTSSPNRPGDPAIVSAQIAVVNLGSATYTDGVRYEFPPASDTTGRATLAASLAAVFDRGGWASGNSICVVCNSAQDASAYQTFSRSPFHDHNSATANSEPHLVIDYTAGGATKAPPPFPRRNRVVYRLRRFR
jgi:hypothetical protein